MQDRFIKATIYTLLGIAVAIFLLLQPFNIYCKTTKKCYPVTFSSVFKGKKGEKEVKINFSSTINEELKNIVVFYPKEQSLSKFSNEFIENSYFVKNLSDEEITIRTKYSADPKEADKYLDRIECLCFQSETLVPNQEKQMPIRFQIKKGIEAEKLPEININYAIEVL